MRDSQTPGNPHDDARPSRADAYWQMPVSDYVAPSLIPAETQLADGNEAKGLLDDEARLDAAWLATVTAFKGRKAEDFEAASKSADALRKHVAKLRKSREDSAAQAESPGVTEARHAASSIRWWHPLFERFAFLSKVSDTLS